MKKNYKSTNLGHVSGEEQLDKKGSVVNPSNESNFSSACAFCLTLGGLAICYKAIRSFINNYYYEQL